MNLFKKLELDFFPNLLNSDIGELAIVKCIGMGYKTYSYRYARLDKSNNNYSDKKKFSTAEWISWYNNNF